MVGWVVVGIAAGFILCRMYLPRLQPAKKGALLDFATGKRISQEEESAI